jgi:outer membrane protein, multidrug efflux system
MPVTNLVVRGAPLRWVLTGLFALVCAGCTVGPNYNRPKVEAPDTYRGATSEAAPAEKPAAEAASLADQKWWEVFQDKELQGLIRVALANNYDARIAATRVLEAQAQLGITRADQFPSLGVGANLTSVRNPTIGPIPAYEFTTGEITATAAWNIDFWGKYRRATEAARANLLASEWARQQVISTLVANVATSYFQLRQLDLELEISRDTLASRRESLQLTTLLTEHGIDTMLDQRQAEELVYTAAAQIPDLERQIAQQENNISLLLGNNPGAVPRGLKLTDQPHPPEVPAGLPSLLLERRPDIRQAEETLVAANAQIGVARAAYFPQISLTGTAGFQSSALSNLFTSGQGVWVLAGALTQPIFEGGRLKNNVRLAEAQKQQMVLTYQQTIKGAFRDVSNALIAYQKNREFRVEQERLTAAAQDAARLSQQRFKAGVSDYLEVLTNETNYFADELELVQAQFNEVQALVQLYQVLGGGWEQ